MSESLGVAVLTLAADGKPLAAGMAKSRAQADRDMAGMQASMDKRLAGMSASMGKVGSSMTRNVTVPIIGLGGAAVKMASEFDAAMERVHTQSGASQREVNQLKGAVLDLAKHSAQGPVDLANSLYRLEGAGYRGAAAMKALKAASQLAAVGNANVEDTTKTLTQALKPGIKGVGDFQSAVAQINATVGAGDMRLQQLVDALGTGVVTSAKQAGLSFKDVTGALAVFGDETNNVSGWAAQFATALHFLTNPTAKASGALEGIGLQSNQLALDMQKPNGLVRALRDLQDHLDATFPKGSGHALTIDQERQALDKYKTALQQAGVSGAALTKDVDKYQAKLKDYGTAAVAQAQTLGDIFPGGRGRVLSVLLNQVDLLQQKERQIAGTTNQFAGDVAKTQETTQFRIHKAWSNIQVDAVKLGQALGPDFLTVGEGIANEADKIATAFLKLPPGARQAIITGGLITAGIGPALKLLSVFTGGVGKLITAEQYAQKLATGKTSLFGGGKGASGLASSVSKVATMEVGELVARNMVGGTAGERGWSPSTGANTGGVAAGKASSTAGAAEGAAAGETGLLAGAKGVASRAVGAGAIGLVGVGASQLAGSMIGGSAGKTVSRLGTGASAGGAIGTMIEPGIGTAVGAAIGAGLAEAITLLHHDSYGSKIADAIFDKGFGGKAADNLKKQTAQALDELHKYTTKAGPTHDDMGNILRPTTQQLSLSSLSPAAQAKAIAAANRAGTLIAKQLQAGWDQYKFQSEPIMFTQLRSKMKDLPPQAQAAAALSAVKFAEGLEKQGRLTKGSAAKMLSDIEHQFPGFEKYLGLAAGAGIDQFNKAFDLTKAQQNTKSQLHKISQDFPQVQDAMSKTAGSVQDKAAATVKALRRIQADGTGPMRRQATADLAALRDSTSKDLSAMGADVVSKSKQMAHAMGANTAAGSKQAATNMGDFTTAVMQNINSGAVGAGQGMNILLKNLNAALKELGQKQLTPIQVASMTLTTGKQAQLARHNAATGALVQVGHAGERGRDNVPMNVGGTDIVVGRGEQVAVLNHDQQRLLNGRLRDMGGLTGMFRKVNRPHYLAGGGWVRTGATIDPTAGQAPTYSAHGGMSFAELLEAGANAGMRPDLTQLLGEARGAYGMPMETAIDVRMPGSKRSFQIWKNDVGSGQTGNSHYTVDLHQAIATALGWNGNADIEVAKAGTDPNAAVTSAGGAMGAVAAAIQKLIAPKLKGSGVIKNIAQAAVNKGTVGANKYLQAHAPGPSTGAGAAAAIPGGGATSGPGGLATFEGVTMAKWIANELQWATAHGWHGQPTSGYRPGYDPHAPGGSEHALISYPGGAVDFGGMTGDPAAYATKLALVKLAARLNYPGPRLMMPIGFQDDGHLSGDGHARGGFLAAFAGGGTATKGGSPTVTARRKAQLAAAKKKAKAKQKPKPIRQPKLKSLAGFTGLDALTNLDTLVGQYQSQQGYLQALNGAGASLEPLVTLADGSTQVVNWGSIGGQSPSGMIDPSTGQITKGIYDRLREIGTPGSTDQGTELGIEDVIVNTWLRQQGLAGGTAKNLARYTRQMQGTVNQETGQVGWLTQAMDLTQPMPAKKLAAKLFKRLGATSMGAVGTPNMGLAEQWLPYAKVILDKVQEYRNAQALIDRWETLKGGIPQARKDRDDAITTAIDARRHQISNGSATATFTGSELLSAAYGELDKQKQDALNGLPSPPPKGWKGDRTTWDAQHARERSSVEAEFSQRKDALRAEAAKKNLSARLKRSNALFDLGQQERTEKSTVSAYFGAQSKALQDEITGERTAKSGDHTWLGNLRSGIGKQLTTAKSYLSTAVSDASTISQSYLSPYSDLAMNIKTAQNVASEPNVAGYLAEIAGLKGTAVPPSTAAASTAAVDNSQLLGLLQQWKASQDLGNAVASRQAPVLADTATLMQTLGQLPAFGGSFLTGGVVPGVTGEPRTIIAHGGERVVPVGGDGVVVESHHHHYWNGKKFDGLVDTRVEQKTRKMARTAMRGLPGKAGVLR